MARALILRGKRMGDRVVTRFPAPLGSADGSFVKFRDPRASPRHATILQRAGRYFIRDEKSASGTLGNGQRIEEKELASGDRIKIGSIEIEVLLADLAEAVEEAGPGRAARATSAAGVPEDAPTPPPGPPPAVPPAGSPAAHPPPLPSGRAPAARRSSAGAIAERVSRKKAPKRPVTPLIMKIDSVIVMLGCLGAIVFLVFYYKGRRVTRPTEGPVLSEDKKLADLFEVEAAAGDECWKSEQWREAKYHYEKAREFFNLAQRIWEKEGRGWEEVGGYDEIMQHVNKQLISLRDILEREGGPSATDGTAPPVMSPWTTSTATPSVVAPPDPEIKRKARERCLRLFQEAKVAHEQATATLAREEYDDALELADKAIDLYNRAQERIAEEHLEELERRITEVIAMRRKAVRRGQPSPTPSPSP